MRLHEQHSITLNNTFCTLYKTLGSGISDSPSLNITDNIFSQAKKRGIDMRPIEGLRHSVAAAWEV